MVGHPDALTRVNGGFLLVIGKVFSKGKAYDPWGDVMDHTRAAELLQAERVRVRDLLGESSDAGRDDRGGVGEQGDMSDPATSLTLEEQEDAINASLRERLAVIERAERRLRDGTYGRSVRSGDVIPDERLEADPAAELTVEEALSA
ncbi:MAG: TraR/DksA family transcriptional regulator [Acidimicrobiales bacterium]